MLNRTNILQFQDPQQSERSQMTEHTVLRPTSTARERVSPSRRDVGPRALDHFESLYKDFQAILDLKSRIRGCKLHFRDMQGRCDCVEAQITHMRSDERIGDEDEIERRKEWCQEWDGRRGLARRELQDLQADLTQREESRDGKWIELYEFATEYFDECFDSDFEGEWSFSEMDCRELRSRLDLYGLIVDTRAEIGQLGRLKAHFKSEIWKIKTSRREERDRTRLPKGLPRKLTSVRKEKLLQEVRQIEAKIEGQKEAEQLRKETLDDLQDSFCDFPIREILERAGRIAREANGSRNNSRNIGTPNQGGAVSERSSARQNHTQSEFRDVHGSPVPPSKAATGKSTPLSKLGVEQLRSRYTELRKALVQRHVEYDRERARSMGHDISHLCTFSNSTRESFEAFVRKQLEDRVQAMDAVEQDLAEIRRRLIQSGGEVPRSPDESLHSVREGGIRKRSPITRNSKASRASPRRRDSHERSKKHMTDWRLAADEAGSLNPNEIDPSPGKSVADTARLWASKSRSPSRAPNSEYDAYLEGRKEQHHKYQAELRRDKGKGK